MSRKRRTPSLDLVLDPETSARLGRVRQANTKPEVLVRSLLHRLGFRFRIGGKGLPGSPDIVNRSKRWAVFVHGCFWHAHSHCKRATIPRRNRLFWAEKFASNRQRDRRSLRQLRRMGYNTTVVWECEVYARPAIMMSRLVKQLGRGDDGKQA